MDQKLATVFKPEYIEEGLERLLGPYKSLFLIKARYGQQVSIPLLVVIA